MDDQGHAHAAAVGVLLVPLERGVAGLRPAPRIVGRAARPADLVQPRLRLVDVVEQRLSVAGGVGDALRAALLAGAVVGHQQQDGVVELARGFEIGDQPPNLFVGVAEESGERLLEGREEPFRIRREVVPGLDAGIARREFRALGNDAEFELSREPLFAHLVPALVELAAVTIDVLLRGLMGRMGRAQREIEEEGLIGIDGLVVAQKALRVIDDVFGEVIAVFRRPGWLDQVVVVDEIGVELIGLAGEEAVEPVKAALQRPVGEGPGGGALLGGTEVPLADRERGVVLVAQHLRHRRGVLADRAAHVWVARVEVGDRAHPDRVMVAAGQQRGSCRRAQRGHVEVREAQPVGRQPVDVRRFDRRSVAVEVRESEVVEEDDHDVRSVLRRSAQRRPPRFGLSKGASDRAFERLARGHRCSFSCPWLDGLRIGATGDVRR